MAQATSVQPGFGLGAFAKADDLKSVYCLQGRADYLPAGHIYSNSGH